MKVLKIELRNNKPALIKTYHPIPCNLGDISADTQIRDSIRDMVRNGGLWTTENVWVPYHEVISASCIDL